MEDLVNKVIEKNPKKLAKWKDREIKGAKILSNHRYSKKDDIIQGVDYLLKIQKIALSILRVDMLKDKNHYKK